MSISNDTFLQAVFDNILGKDVVKKLLLVSETSCNGVGLYVCEDVVAETTKLLSKNKQGQTGLSVLLSRQVKSMFIIYKYSFINSVFFINIFTYHTPISKGGSIKKSRSFSENKKDSSKNDQT